MSDPHVREIGRIEDIDGDQLIVGVSHDTVMLSRPDAPMPHWQLNSRQAEELARLFVRACWEAGKQDGAA